MQPPVFVANWKMYHGPMAATQFARRFVDLYRDAREDRTVVICPPAASIEAVARELDDRADIWIGAQNIWTEPRGAFTGEVSAEIVAEAGARLVLVGHSERRRVFGETNAQTARKVALASSAGMIPVLCVGETIEQREAGKTVDVVLSQLREGLVELGDELVSRVLIAYEPVWAIGTGKTPTTQDAAAVHAAIRFALRDRAGDEADEMRVLYGGSVNAGNAGPFLTAPDVDGLLVGGASLTPEGWAEICLT